LTTASCSPVASASIFAFVSSHEGKEVEVGKISSSSINYYPENGFDFSVIKMDPDFWDPNLSMST